MSPVGTLLHAFRLTGTAVTGVASPHIGMRLKLHDHVGRDIQLYSIIDNAGAIKNMYGGNLIDDQGKAIDITV